GAIAAAPVADVSAQALPAAISRAVDLRALGNTAVLLVAADAGAVRVELDDLSMRTVRGAGTASGRLWVPSRLGVGGDFVVAAAPLFRLDGFRTGAEASWSLSFETIEDVDLQGRRLAVLGLRRDDRGRVAPDGAWLWVGEIGIETKAPTMK